MSRCRSHVGLTVWPLAVLFVLALVRSWPALDGAPAYAAASPTSWAWLLVTTFAVIFALAAYAWGWSARVFDPSEGAGPYRTAGCVRLQKLAGGLAWGFAVVHLVFLWSMTVRAGPAALSHYELMRSFLSRPLVLGVYVGGLAALGLYLAQGAAASFRAWGFARRRGTSLATELSCTLASALVMLLAVNVLSHFATGRAYWTPDRPIADRSSERSEVGRP